MHVTFGKAAWCIAYTTFIGFSHFLVVLPIEFPNQVVGVPQVDCQVDGIRMTVQTSTGSPSHMYVKGRAHEPSCVTRNTNVLTIEQERCDVTRERSLNPAGVFYRVCIVVQLHPQFITKVDKTFCANCFYMEAVKELTQELGVSVLSSTEVAISFPMPACSYTIRKGSITGPEIKYATVGDSVFHVWHCPSVAYGLLVQNCYVDDSQGNKILIIDQNGCGVDRYVIQTPNYSEDLTSAFQESHVFKFADKTITRFTCQIKVCIKAGGTCSGITPPKSCGSTVPYVGATITTAKASSINAATRAKRRNFRALQNEYDVTGPAMHYLYSSEVGLSPVPAAPGNATKVENISEYDTFNADELIDVTGELIVLEDMGSNGQNAAFMGDGIKQSDQPCVSETWISKDGILCIRLFEFIAVICSVGAIVLLVVISAFRIYHSIHIYSLCQKSVNGQLPERMQTHKRPTS